jgi:hypothetical protein
MRENFVTYQATYTLAGRVRLTLPLWCTCRRDRRHSVVLEQRGVSRQTRATLHAALRTRDHPEESRFPKDPTGNDQDTRTGTTRHTQMKRQAEWGVREIVKRQIGSRGGQSVVTVSIDTVSQSHILRISRTTYSDDTRIPDRP